MSYPPNEQFASLPLIHFLGQDLPNYFIFFGPHKKQGEKKVNSLKNNGVEYKMIKVLDIYWDDKTRPEFFWRSFKPIETFDRDSDAVYIYRRITPR